GNRHSDQEDDKKQTGRIGGAHYCCPWLDAANSLFPVLASVTARAFALLLSSLARLPSTVTTSPVFIAFLSQPTRIRPFGLPISMPQLTILPDEASLTSM